MGRVYLAPVSFGLGDLVVSLPAIQALIERGDETWLVARSPAQVVLARRVDGLAGCVAEDGFDGSGADGRVVDLRDHPLQRDHWWGSPAFEQAYGPLRINDILGRICADFGIDADFTRPVGLSTLGRLGLDSSVLFIADTDGAAKRWPLDRWCTLASSIRDRGLDVGVVTRDGSGGVDGIGAVCAPSPGDAVDVLSSARAVVGVDTGLTHIAAQQSTATVTISRPPDVYFRSWPHTRSVTGRPCDPVCVALDQQRAYNDRVDLRGLEWEPRRCPSEGGCLDAVRPDDVMRALEEVL